MDEKEALNELNSGLAEMISSHVPTVAASMWRQFLGSRLKILIDANNARSERKNNRRAKP